MQRFFVVKKRGMTLVELLVSMFILGIVMTGLTTFFVYMWRSKNDEINRGQSMISASMAVSKMGENIRRTAQADSGAYALALANDFEFIFYSDIDGDEHRERVHYYKNGNSIIIGTAEPILGDTPTYPTDDETTTTLVSNLTNTASEPIFSYYNSSGSLMATPASLPSIRRIKLSVSVNTSPERMSDTVIETSIAPRNINK